MAGDGKVNVKGGVEGGKLLAGIWTVGSIFARNVEGGGIFVSSSNGLYGTLQGMQVTADHKGGKFP